MYVKCIHKFGPLFCLRFLTAGSQFYQAKLRQEDGLSNFLGKSGAPHFLPDNTLVLLQCV